MSLLGIFDGFALVPTKFLLVETNFLKNTNGHCEFFFSVLCTTPNKYVVVDAAGAVKPQCCVDM